MHRLPLLRPCRHQHLRGGAEFGRSRAIRQDGDSSERIQEAIDTCPVDCIHWVAFEDLDELRDQLACQHLQPLGMPQAVRKRRLRPSQAS